MHFETRLNNVPVDPFNPSLWVDGQEVWIHVPYIHATTWQAKYTIQHADGQSIGVVDQNGLSNQWVSIGVYRFEPDTGDYVRINDATGEGYRVHCYDAIGSAYGTNWCDLGVDAVKFVRRAPAYLPDVQINNSGWNSLLSIRNNGGTAFIHVAFYDQNGVWRASTWNANLAGHGV